ncbi:rho GTPase-activating protein 30-like, partial [Hemiscyllium ocellatum]|uniref:rho GTPase-activating protein 30-like n=1 Tax=Hemiscyllium ocellatum TaxID=170820 RepID=UPI0029663037
PQVLTSCAQFIEEHGIVDGIYRLSGISSNIQKLRQEYDAEKTADLTQEIYLQDIHCVSSLCKAYFRELPNPLLTYQLYDKFADAVNTQLEEDRLLKICSVLEDLPAGHYRTLEFLMRHLLRMASHSSKTNMHARNLAIVWAPNLLRSKEIESSGFNGTAAFMEVRVQSIVVEFILNHVEQLFDHKNLTPVPGVHSDDRRKSLPSPSSAPNLTSEESGPRILPSHIPHMLHMGDGPPAIRPYHSIIELPEHRRKGSLKVKKWKSIFNLGRSGTDSKRKASRNDDRDIKCDTRNLRPAKSMDSLSSVPFTDDGSSPGLDDRQPHGNPSARRDSFGSVRLSSPDHRAPAFSSLDAELLLDRGVAEAPVLRVGADSPRSAKAARQRAEKRVAMHISGPFSVSLPEHVTSLLKATEHGAVGIRGPEEPQDRSSSEEQDNDDEEEVEEEEEEENDAPRELVAEETQVEQEAMDGHDPLQGLPIGSEITLELQDTFSFLDTQDTLEIGDTETDYPGELGMPLRTPEEMEPYDYYAQSYHERRGTLDMSIESELMDLDLDLRELRAYDAQVHCQEFSVEPPVEEEWSLNDSYEHASADSGTPHHCPAETARSGKQCQGPELCATDLRTPSPPSEAEKEARNVDCSTAALAGGGEHPGESSSGSGKAGCSTVTCCAEQLDPAAGSAESGNTGCSAVACRNEQLDPAAGSAESGNTGCSAVACSNEQPDPAAGSTESGNTGCSAVACRNEQPDPAAGSPESGNTGCSAVACRNEQPNPGTGSRESGNTGSSAVACRNEQPVPGAGSPESGNAGSSTIACRNEQPDPGTGSPESGNTGGSAVACRNEQPDPGAGSAGCSTEGTFTVQDETDGEVGRPALTPSPVSLAPSPGRIYQARSLPVVPPKPHYAKLPLALKGKRRTDNPTHPEVRPRPPATDHAHSGPETRPALTDPAHQEIRSRPPSADHAHCGPGPRPAMTVPAHPDFRPRPPTYDHAHHCAEPRPRSTLPDHPEDRPRPPRTDHAHCGAEPRPPSADPAPSDDQPRPRDADFPEDRPRPCALGHAPAGEGPRPQCPEAAPSEPLTRARASAHAWRTAASLSFDEAVALAKRRRGRPGVLQRGDSAPDAPRGARERLSVPHLPSERAVGAARCRSLVLEAEEAP